MGVPPPPAPGSPFGMDLELNLNLIPAFDFGLSGKLPFVMVSLVGEAISHSAPHIPPTTAVSASEPSELDLDLFNIA